MQTKRRYTVPTGDELFLGTGPKRAHAVNEPESTKGTGTKDAKSRKKKRNEK